LKKTNANIGIDEGKTRKRFQSKIMGVKSHKMKETNAALIGIDESKTRKRFQSKIMGGQMIQTNCLSTIFNEKQKYCSNHLDKKEVQHLDRH
jgi:hypothetical protein